NLIGPGAFQLLDQSVVPGHGANFIKDDVLRTDYRGGKIRVEPRAERAVGVLKDVIRIRGRPGNAHLVIGPELNLEKTQWEGIGRDVDDPVLAQRPSRAGSKIRGERCRSVDQSTLDWLKDAIRQTLDLVKLTNDRIP